MASSPAAPRSPRRARLLSTAAALVLAVCAPLFSASSASALPMNPTERAWAAHIVSQINGERARHHLPPLTVRTRLVNSARLHNFHMAKYNDMSHQVAGEPGLANRVTHQGYRWRWLGENIAWNSDISQDGVTVLERSMYNELPPENGHRLNILSRDFRNVGVDVFIDHKHGKIWMTEDFGAS